VHASKGREADHVIISGLEHGGFPCEIEDDPLLSIALPDADPYPFADERRLFYVALTRARRDVLLLTRQYRESAFVEELVADGLQLLDPTGRPMPIVRCPTCSARMRLKDGKYGPFWSCSRYRPDRTGCNPTQPATDDTAAQHGANKHA
jgi:DNA helicase-4